MALGRRAAASRGGDLRDRVGALSGADLLNARDDLPLYVFGAAAVVAIAGRWRERARLGEA